MYEMKSVDVKPKIIEAVMIPMFLSFHCLSSARLTT